MSEEAWLVGFGLLAPNAITHGQGKCIVEGLHLAHSNRRLIVNCNNGGIFAVQPSSLHVGLLLRIALGASQGVSGVVLSSEARHGLGLLHIKGSYDSSSLS